MKKLMRKHKDEGFTLAELLIVVAIIAVLVAVSVPIFNTQLEKAREATDMANIRGAYAVLKAATLDEELADSVNGMYITVIKRGNDGFTGSVTLPTELDYTMYADIPTNKEAQPIYIDATWSTKDSVDKWVFEVSASRQGEKAKSLTY